MGTHLEGVSDGLTPDTWKERAGARGHSADLCKLRWTEKCVVTKITRNNCEPSCQVTCSRHVHGREGKHHTERHQSTSKTPP